MKQKKGFAALSPERRRKLQSKGGKSVPSYKRAFTRDRQLASRAGKIGGQNTPEETLLKTRSFTDKDFARRMRERGLVMRGRDWKELAILRQGASKEEDVKK